jgi:hypothetical protein
MTLLCGSITKQTQSNRTSSESNQMLTLSLTLFYRIYLDSASWRNLSVELFTTTVQEAYIAKLAAADGLPVACHKITNIASGSGASFLCAKGPGVAKCNLLSEKTFKLRLFVCFNVFWRQMNAAVLVTVQITSTSTSTISPTAAASVIATQAMSPTSSLAQVRWSRRQYALYSTLSLTCTF